MTILFLPLFSPFFPPVLCALILKLTAKASVNRINVLTVFVFTDDVALQLHWFAALPKLPFHSPDASTDIDDLYFVLRMHPCNCGFMHVHEKGLLLYGHFKELLRVSITPDQVLTVIIDTLNLWVQKMKSDDTHVHIREGTMELIER